ncbi:MAG: proton-conducting transporter membrane subunit [Brevefilum sp.]|nr:proton-conducting transporter membrane subunit [Brevefilum sp.]
MTLSTPILWVILPLFISLITGIFYRRRILGMILTCTTGFGLGALAAFFPEDLVISIGPLTLNFVENLSILGRQININYQILPFVAFIYFSTGLWAVGSIRPSVPESFRPTSLVITALLTAALGVEPFLYAALFIEGAILFSVPMLSPLLSKTHPGILRFICLQTLALPFILLAGWLLSGVETLPPDSPLIVQTMIILGLGIGLWLAVFPFHSWVPMVSEKAHPLPVSFVLFIFPTVITLFSLNFLDRYTFLRTSQGLYQSLRSIGTLMIVLGGLWTAYQDDIKRAFGFSALSETGFLLLAIGLADQGGLSLLLMLFPAHAVSFWLWGFTLSLIETRADSRSIEVLHGFAQRYPIISSGLLVAQLSIAGLPLFATFPVKIALFSEAFAVRSGLGVWIFVGSLGLFFFSVRLLINLVTPNTEQAITSWVLTEKANVYLPILLTILAVIIMGLFPHAILTNITTILTAFGQLQ